MTRFVLACVADLKSCERKDETALQCDVCTMLKGEYPVQKDEAPNHSSMRTAQRHEQWMHIDISLLHECEAACGKTKHECEVSMRVCRETKHVCTKALHTCTGTCHSCHGMGVCNPLNPRWVFASADALHRSKSGLHTDNALVHKGIAPLHTDTVLLYTKICDAHAQIRRLHGTMSPMQRDLRK